MELRQSYLIALSSLLLLGAAPSRTQTYVAGQIISPTAVTENEDNIFSYLQAGVDTYRSGTVDSTAIANGTITSTDISSSAAIPFSSLGSLTSGNLLLGNSSNVATSTAMSGDVTISNTGVTTIGADKVALTTDTTGNYVKSLADAGNTTITVTNGATEGGAATVDAIDVNCSNCIDGTDIALGSDAQGDIMYYNGTDWVRLGAGTSGQVLKTNGAGANPSWGTGVQTALISYGTGSTIDGTFRTIATITTPASNGMLAVDFHVYTTVVTTLVYTVQVLNPSASAVTINGFIYQLGATTNGANVNGTSGAITASGTGDIIGRIVLAPVATGTYTFQIKSSGSGDDGDCAATAEWNN